MPNSLFVSWPAPGRGIDACLKVAQGLRNDLGHYRGQRSSGCGVSQGSDGAATALVDARVVSESTVSTQLQPVSPLPSNFGAGVAIASSNAVSFKAAMCERESEGGAQVHLCQCDL